MHASISIRIFMELLFSWHKHRKNIIKWTLSLSWCHGNLNLFLFGGFQLYPDIFYSKYNIKPKVWHSFLEIYNGNISLNLEEGQTYLEENHNILPSKSIRENHTTWVSVWREGRVAKI